MTTKVFSSSKGILSILPVCRSVDGDWEWTDLSAQDVRFREEFDAGDSLQFGNYQTMTPFGTQKLELPPPHVVVVERSDV